MRRVLIIVGIVAALAGGARLGLLLRGQVEPQSAPRGAGGVNLDAWQELAQQYQRPFPAAKSPIVLRLPPGFLGSVTVGVTVNGEAPAACAGSGPCRQ